MSRARVVASTMLAIILSHEAFAQNAQTGQALCEKWCLSCHAKSDPDGRQQRPRSLQSIANTEKVDFGKIVQFLQMSHGRMPDLPLSRTEIEDIAAYISQLKK